MKYEPRDLELVRSIKHLITCPSTQRTVTGFQGHIRRHGTLGAIGRQSNEFYDAAAVSIIRRLRRLDFVTFREGGWFQKECVITVTDRGIEYIRSEVF